MYHLADNISIQIDPTLLNAPKILRGSIVKSLKVAGDHTQNVIRDNIEKNKLFIIRSGFLRDHILRDKVNIRDLSVTITAHVTDPPYGLYLNEGTRNIKPIQYMEKGLKKSLPGIERAFGKKIKI